MDDFRRVPKRSVAPSTPPVVADEKVAAAEPVAHMAAAQEMAQALAPAVTEVHAPQPIEGDDQKKSPRRKKLLWIILSAVFVALAAVGAVVALFFAQLRPVDSDNTDKQAVLIESGSTPSTIAEQLKDEGLINSVSAFLLYARIKGVENSLQAGTYRLSPSESTGEIIEHLSNGVVDTFSVTFLPGATLADNRDVLIATGFSEQEVDEALAKSYDSPLFEGKPVSADLEGYIYGETYSFGTDATVESILEYVFAHFYSVVEESNLVAAYEAQGLSLYEGITLASIVQREASPEGDDMPQIAQVFYSRLAIDMQLGSDVTYQYIADKTGVARDPNLDSLYNTRKYTGLPPGPISAPGEKALLAVANPADGDYLYFLSGDDDITYFARTNEEHEANIQNHCQKKCQIL